VALQNERYVLNWAGKSDAYKTLQSVTTATLALATTCFNVDYIPISDTSVKSLAGNTSPITGYQSQVTIHYYPFNDNETAFQLSGKPGDAIPELLSIKPQRVIMLDRLFEDNDQLKTNTVLQFKEAGVEFRTV
jgi:hypothetical protein